jgi:Protein of unknown function (DUF3540)
MEHAPFRAGDGAPATERPAEPLAGDRLDALVEAMEVPRPPASSEVRETYATVESCAGGVVVVRVGDRPVEARRAVSCLVEPAAGDRVLVALSDESFVLAVLVRGERRGVTLSVDGDVTLRARGGKLGVVADGAVTLASGARVEINAPELEVRAMKTSFFSASLSYVGRALDAEVGRLKLVAETVDRTIDRVSERLKRSFRTIEQIERVRAKELDVDVEGNVNVHADNTIMNAEKLVKVDGEQIHLG